MRRGSWSVLLVSVVAVLVSKNSYAQDRSHDPTVVVEPQKPPQGPNSPVFPGRFGLTCQSSNYPAKKPGYLYDKPTSISERMGAPIQSVTVHRYGPGWKSPEDVRRHVLALLEAKTPEVFNYEPWAEAVFADIVATVQFSDHTQGAFEVSGVHVCFVTHSGAPLWTRVLVSK